MDKNELNEWNERLFESIRSKNLESVKECLENGANPNAKEGHTALSWAIAIQPNLDIVKALVEKGADVNAKSDKRENVSSMTPLSKSLYENSIEIAKYLIENGADVTAKDDDRLTPLHWICNKSKEYGNNNMSYTIAINKNIETYEFAKMLINKGADVNAENEYFKETPLFWAVNKDTVSYMHIIAELLIENGADVNHKNKDEQTPLMVTASEINLEAINLLIEHGANVSIKDKNGKTALDYAKAVITLDKNGAERKAQVNKFLENVMQKQLEKGVKEKNPKLDKSKEKSKSKSQDFGISM